MAKYKVVVGDTFEVDAVDVSDVAAVVALAEVAAEKEKRKTREKLTYSIVGAVFAALMVAVAIGFVDGTYDEVSAIWAAAAMPLGYVFGTYFDKKS